MATSLARVPGDLPCPANASAPSVHATAATGTSVASSTSLPTRLDDHRLARDERARRVAGVNRGDAVNADPLDQQLARVVGVDGPQLGLNRGRQLELHLVVRLVERAGEPDHRVRVHEARRGDLRRQRPVAGRNPHLTGAPDALDLAVLADQDHAVRDRRPRHRVHRRRLHRDLRHRGRRVRPQHKRRQKPQSHARPLAELKFGPTTASAHSSFVIRHSSFPDVLVRLVIEVQRLAASSPVAPVAKSRSSGTLRSNTFFPSTHVCSTCV